MTAAERILLDANILTTQVSILEDAAADVRGATDAARTQLSGTAFGAMNAFLVGPLNHWASRSAECTASVGEMTTRMSEGVDAALKAFTEYEREASETIQKALAELEG